jgi:uncharacterized protein YaiI (UPF0178 family)
MVCIKGVIVNVCLVIKMIDLNRPQQIIVFHNLKIVLNATINFHLSKNIGNSEMKKKRTPNTIWIDADACPKQVREIAFKAGHRTKIKIILVANSYLTIPHSDLIRLIIVDKGLDVADQHIEEHVEQYDLVITADIPLASKVVAKGALAINPRGEIYDEENIGEILSMRDFMKDLRDGGLVSGGPASFGPKDTERFANSLNQLLS